MCLRFNDPTIESKPCGIYSYHIYDICPYRYVENTCIRCITSAPIYPPEIAAVDLVHAFLEPPLAFLDPGGLLLVTRYLGLDNGWFMINDGGEFSLRY